MSSFDRRTLLLSFAALSACGFEPAYGPAGPAARLRGTVLVDGPTDRNSFDLTRRLEDRLGRASTPIYSLTVALELSEDDLGITTAQEITRYNVLGKASYVLRDLGSEDLLTTGVAETFTSYSATGTTVSTVTARQDAYERLMIALADQIVTQLVATSGAWAR